LKGNAFLWLFDGLEKRPFKRLLKAFRRPSEDS